MPEGPPVITVLVVDDNAMDRVRAGGLLKKHPGLTVVFADNGVTALAMIAKGGIDVVVTDLQMPEMDGLELVRELRRAYPNIPVILMTAHGSEEIAVKALQSGAASYVPKSQLAKELYDTVIAVVELARAKRDEARVIEHLAYTETRLALDNDVSLLASVTGFLQSNLTRLRSCDETLLLQIGVALREALANAIIHGNLEVSSALREGSGKAYDDLIAARRNEPRYSARKVHVTARETRDDVTYVIQDEGPGFDVDALPDPNDPAELERESGRGLLLIRMFMDEVTHNKSGNVITMVKRFGAESALL